MLVHPGVAVHLDDFRFRNVAGINPANGFPLVMNLQHDLVRRRIIQAKKLLQDFYHETHGGIIVVDQVDTEPTRRLGLNRVGFERNIR